MVLIADTVAEFVAAAEKARKRTPKAQSGSVGWMLLEADFLGSHLGRHDSSDRVCKNVKAQAMR
jgi:hypothetical protein